MTPALRRTLIGLVLFAAAAVFNFFWASQSSPPVSGTIVEAGSGKPIAMAAVLLEWHGEQAGPWFPVWAPGAHGSGRVCYRYEFAVTDETGRYHVPAWRQFGVLGVANAIRHNYTVMRVLRPGFEPYHGLQSRSVELRRFQGSGRDLFEKLRDLQMADPCIGFREKIDSAWNMAPFLLVLYNNMEPYATTEHDRTALENIVFDAIVSKAAQGK